MMTSSATNATPLTMTSDTQATPKFTEFDYLLNAMEAAAMESVPADHGYADKRKAVLAYVAAALSRAERAEQELAERERCDAFLVRAIKLTRGADVSTLISTENGRPILYATCSDTFFWGSADLEKITPENIDALEQAIKDLGDNDFFAGELFAARNRGIRPQGASYAEYYPPETWPLFDACGPEREAGLGNPTDRAKLPAAPEEGRS